MFKEKSKELSIFLGFIATSIMLVWGFGQQPLRRFPNWDYTWIDSISVSRLHDLQISLQNHKITQYNFFSGLGSEKLGEIAGYLNPANPLNLLLLLDIKPELFILIKTIFFLIILQIGTYKYICSKTNDKIFSIFSALIASSLPVFWSMLLGTTIFNLICAVPLVLFLYEQNIQSNQKKYIATYALLMLCIGLDLITTACLGLLNIALIFSSGDNKFKIKKRLKNFSTFSIVNILATSSFWFPYYLYLNQRSEVLNLNSIEASSRINFTDYFLFLLQNGLHTFLYPIEGSALQLYVPVFFILLIGIFLVRKNKNYSKASGNVQQLLIMATFISLAPAFLYVFPVTSKYAISYFRSNLNFLPILLLIASLLILFNIKHKHSLRILISATVLEFFLFLINPFEMLRNVLPYGENILKILETKNQLFDSGLRDPLKFNFPFWTHSPWSNLIILNVLIILTFMIILNREHFKLDGSNKKLAMVSIPIILVAFMSLSTHIELRRYMNNWQQISTSDFRLVNYQKRTENWIKKFSINDPNYRVLLAGKETDQDEGRNIKLVLDSELNNFYKMSVIPQYREAERVEMAINLLQLNCPSCSLSDPKSLYASHPPTVDQVEENSKWLKANSVKYVITADQQIASTAFTLLDSFKYPLTNSGYDETENGEIFLYVFKEHQPIIRVDQNHASVSDLKIDQQGLSFQLDTDKSQDILINYYFTKGFRATFNGAQINIEMQKNNRILLKAPSGSGEIALTYRNSAIEILAVFTWTCALLLLMYLLSPRQILSFIKSKSLRK